MSHKIMKYRMCDGCYRDTVHDDIEIVREKKFVNRHNEERVVHMCGDCEMMDRTICSECATVHGDDRPCVTIEEALSFGKFHW